MFYWIVLFFSCFLALTGAQADTRLQASSAAIEPVIGPDYQKAALVNIELGLGYLEQGQVARAKTKLTHALKLAPQSSEARSAMAYFLEMTGDYKEAEKSHKKAVRLAKQKGAAYNNYGAFLCRRTRFKEADRVFQLALEDKNYARTAEVYENAGLCAKEAGRLPEAIDYWKTALLRDPMSNKALLELATVALESGRLSESLEYLQRYRSFSAPSARSLWLGIQVARAQGDQNMLASQALLLKNLFEQSKEYAAYLESERTPSAARTSEASE